MQNSLNDWIKENPSPNGYFTVVQFDDGPLLDLPKNTIVYGACSGDEILPLVYQDINDTLIKIPENHSKINLYYVLLLVQIHLTIYYRM